MSIIIAGTLDFAPGTVARIITDARALIEAAQAEDGCIAYNWSEDPLVAGRMHVYEEWTTEGALVAHFANPAYLDMSSHLQASGMLGAEVKKYRFDLTEPVYDDTGTPRADFFSAAK